MKYRYRESHEMKDSGVEWLGMIPKEWELKKMKYILKERKEKNDPIKTDYILSLMIEKGVIPYSEKGNVGNKAKEDLSQYKIARPKDIIINSMNIIIGAVGLSNYFGVLSPVYYTLFSTGEDVNPYFYYKVFQSKGFQKSLLGLGNGILDHRMRIPMEKLGNVFLPFISRENQQKIADFLDKKCEEFDSIIVKKELLIKKLEEAKKNLISEVITGKVKVIKKENGEYGIIKREDYEMKDSGVEWLGMIPKEWEKNSIRRVLKKIIQGDSPTSPVNDTLYKVLKLSAIKEGKFYKDENKPIEEKSYQNKYQLEKGDFLVTRGNTPELVADSCIVQEDINEKIMISDLIYRLYFDENKVLINYMLLCFQSYYFRTQIKLSARGTSLSMVKVSQEHIKNWLFLLPSLNEQHIISKYLDRKCESIDNFIKNNNKIIEKLKLAKQSLISETVTGKIEIL